MANVNYSFPCDVGETVWAYLGYSGFPQLFECIVSEICIYKDYPEPIITVLCQKLADYDRFWVSEFGKEIFNKEQYYTLNPPHVINKRHRKRPREFNRK